MREQRTKRISLTITDDIHKLAKKLSVQRQGIVNVSSLVAMLIKEEAERCRKK